MENKEAYSSKEAMMKVLNGDIDKLWSEKDKYIENTYNRFPVDIVRGNGVIAWDRNNREYIDLTSGIGVNSLGYCDEGWIAAVSSQITKIQHASNLYNTIPAIALAEQLCLRTGMSRVFFSNSGAEANECAIKAARKYSFTNYTSQDRYEIITLENSFHGRTIATLEATGQESFHRYFGPFTEGFSYVKANDIESLKHTAGEKTCAVMIELIQGEGGVVPLDKEYVEQVAEFCKEKDLLLIVDEVQTGIGRTGTLYCYQHYGIRPDIVTSAKGLGGGLPIGATLFSERVAGTLSVSLHGSTFGGNPAVCAGALEVICRMNDEMLESIAERGKYIKEKCFKLTNVTGVTGRGLMLGLSLKEGMDARKVAEKALEYGVLVLTAKDRIRLLPPLIIRYQEIDEALERLEAALKNF